jgi:hypothetical protein
MQTNGEQTLTLNFRDNKFYAEGFVRVLIQVTKLVCRNLLKSICRKLYPLAEYNGGGRGSSWN